MARARRCKKASPHRAMPREVSVVEVDSGTTVVAKVAAALAVNVPAVGYAWSPPETVPTVKGGVIEEYAQEPFCWIDPAKFMNAEDKLRSDRIRLPLCHSPTSFSLKKSHLYQE